MKILHVVNSLEAGGMENGIANLAGPLEARGFSIHVACLERRGIFAERLPHPDQVIALGKRSGFSPRAVWNLATCIGRLRPDIVHSHNLGPLIYSGLATRLTGHRFLIHGEHSLLTAEERTPRRLRQRRWFYRVCQAVHTVSRAMRQELIGLGLPGTRIVAISNGVDTKRYTPGERQSARAALGLPPEGCFIGIVGRFGPFKEHRQLLTAFEQISIANPAVHLVIAGAGGSEEHTVTEWVHHSPSRNRIHWLGFQSNPATCYQALNLLAVPSRNEGLSNAALEAMACGVPVLGRIDCGHEEVIASDVDGWIAPLETPDQLARTLIEILSSPDRLVDFGIRARKKVEAHYSLSTMTDAYERLYLASASR